MNPSCQSKLKINHSKRQFPACQKWALLLKTSMETARAPFRGGEVFAFISLFERWFLSTDSQAGDFLPWLIGGSRGPSHCGIGVSEPQDTGFDKLQEMIKLEIVS
jgi:hypothetical protein